MKMTLSYHYLSVNLDLLDNLGFPRAYALDVLGIQDSDLLSRHERMRINKFQNCLNAAAKHTSDPYIGLRLGHKFRVGSFGNTGSIYSFCENLEEVISMNNLYQKLTIDAGKVYYLHKPNGSHHMCFMPYYSDFSHYRLLTDMIMASYITAYRWLSWGSGEDIISAEIPYINRSLVQSYEDILQTRIVNDSEDICIQLADVAMSQNITTHNAESLVRSRMALDKLLGDQMAGWDFERAIEVALRSAIEAGQVSADIVAQRMGLSRSALRSQLSTTGEGIRPRLDRVRKSLFIEKFEAGNSFAQIAMDLAYNDQAAMNRAFRRWFDMTPTQYKSQAKKPNLEAY